MTVCGVQTGKIGGIVEIPDLWSTAIHSETFSIMYAIHYERSTAGGIHNLDSSHMLGNIFVKSDRKTISFHDFFTL